MDKLLQVIINEEVEDYFLLEEMRKRKGGETIGYEEFMKKYDK